jgi:hypothetical protein
MGTHPRIIRRVSIIIEKPNAFSKVTLLNTP